MKIEELALSFVPNLEPRAIVHLLELFGDAGAIYACSEAELVSRAGLRADIARSIASGTGLDAAAKELKHCESEGVTVLCASQEGYPNRLRYTSDYPHIIYMVGDVSLADSPSVISLVGERESMSSYANKMVLRTIEQLADLMPEVVIVGMLEGAVDGLALRYAVNCGMRAIGVATVPLAQMTVESGRHLATEILEAGGAIVSQVGVMSAADRDIYSASERIVAGMCDAMVIVECGQMLDIARCADSYGRTLCAVPGRATDSMSWGANRMIASGLAQMVCTGRDIAEILEQS
ncbi:MAG: DNA-processing protein DprA [Alistipes sp.]|nr:DNA-processing protein DprA [Alistipes sp.]